MMAMEYLIEYLFLCIFVSLMAVSEQRLTTFTTVTLSLFVGAVILGESRKEFHCRLIWSLNRREALKSFHVGLAVGYDPHKVTWFSFSSSLPLSFLPVEPWPLSWPSLPPSLSLCLAASPPPCPSSWISISTAADNNKGIDWNRNWLVCFSRSVATATAKQVSSVYSARTCVKMCVCVWLSLGIGCMFNAWSKVANYLIIIISLLVSPRR